MSELDDLRAQLVDLRAYLDAQLTTIGNVTARQLARERLAEARALERRLAPPALVGGFPTREGQPADAQLAAPLTNRLRADYATPAGELDRLVLQTTGLFDSASALELFFTLPGSVYDAYECYITLSLTQFYATATAAASGGGSTPTSGASSANSSGASDSSTTTSSAAASSSTTTGASSASSSGASSDTTTSSSAASSSSSTTGGNAPITSYGLPDDYSDYDTTIPNNNQTSSSDGLDGLHHHLMSNHYHNHRHNSQHYHSVDSHTHGMSHTHNHSHNLPHTHPIGHTHGFGHTHSHDHDMPHTHPIPHTHQVTIASHTHSLTYGIYKEAMPASWSVRALVYEYVASAWVLRFTSNPTTELAFEFDLSAYITGAGKWKIAFLSDAGQPNNGRLCGQVFGYLVGAIRAA